MNTDRALEHEQHLCYRPNGRDEGTIGREGGREGGGESLISTRYRFVSVLSRLWLTHVVLRTFSSTAAPSPIMLEMIYSDRETRRQSITV